jgi:uncharacterized protein DUF6069
LSARRLWTGGAAAGLVAALIVVAGIAVCRAVLGIPVLAPERVGAWGDSDTLRYALGAALAALLATGLMHVLLLMTSRPHTIFIQVMSLATLVVAQAPFDLAADTDTQIALAIINLVLGAVIGMLVDASAHRAAPGFHRPGAEGTR